MVRSPPRRSQFYFLTADLEHSTPECNSFYSLNTVKESIEIEYKHYISKSTAQDDEILSHDHVPISRITSRCWAGHTSHQGQLASDNLGNINTTHLHRTTLLKNSPKMAGASALLVVIITVIAPLKTAPPNTVDLPSSARSVLDLRLRNRPLH